MPSTKVSNGNDKQEYQGEPTDDALANGPMENRSCTDVLCCLLFIAFMGGMIAVAAYSISKGNPNLIGRGYDQDGKICGIDDGYTDYPYLYFAVPVEKYLTSTLCLKSCPTSNNAGTVDCKTNTHHLTCTQTKSLTYLSSSGSYGADDIFVYSSFEFVSRYCLPTQVADLANSAISNAGNIDTLQQWFSDIKTTWPVIAVSLACAFVIGFIYMILMRFCSGVLTWIAIIGFIAGNAILGWRFYEKGKAQAETNDSTSSSSSSSKDTADSLKIIGYILWGISAFTFIAVLCLFNRIRLAIAIMKAASDYVRETMSVFLLPPFTCLVLVAFYVYWTITALYLVSSGDKVTDNSSPPLVSFTYDMKLKRLLIYHLFGLLWFNAFILAATQFVISSSVCLWYFSQGTGQGATGTIRKSIYRLIRYHIGSIAFGSLIIAIIQLIRIMLSYAQYQAKKLQGKEGKVVKYALACLQCYVACFERFIRFLNKNAYIQIALTGKNFCISAKNAFFLILRNPLRFGVVAGIGGVFIAFGKIFIGGITALGGYLVITQWDKYSTQIYSPFFPTAVIFIFAYCIGAIFMTVYGLAADTILACFVVDEELNKKKNAPPRHCPETLKSFLDKNKKD